MVLFLFGFTRRLNPFLCHFTVKLQNTVQPTLNKKNFIWVTRLKFAQKSRALEVLRDASVIILLIDKQNTSVHGSTHCRFLLSKTNDETDHKIILTSPYVSAVKYCKFMFLEFSKAKLKHLSPPPQIDAKKERNNNSRSVCSKNLQNRINLF